MDTNTRFPSRVFTGAAVYGILVLAPQYVMEARVGRDFPPPVTHPEHFYGFIGVALAWQLAFLVIARDVRRFRPLMPVAVLEKVAFGVPALLLYAQGRLALPVAAAGAFDLVLGALFLLAYRATPPAEAMTAM